MLEVEWIQLCGLHWSRHTMRDPLASIGALKGAAGDILSETPFEGVTFREISSYLVERVN